MPHQRFQCFDYKREYTRTFWKMYRLSCVDKGTSASVTIKVIHKDLLIMFLEDNSKALLMSRGYNLLSNDEGRYVRWCCLGRCLIKYSSLNPFPGDKF